jgi:hypothetical protein
MMLASYDEWKATDDLDCAADYACPCAEPGFTGDACPVCDGCPCCGAIGLELCEQEVAEIERCDTIRAPRFESIAAE